MRKHIENAVISFIDFFFCQNNHFEIKNIPERITQLELCLQ
jgi:hypothetical protein